ncbi:hypothetical protein GUJ93_ZPchr0009g904 [Zizania palustris]|uniref:Uncharacterized protein n=1 Tax=Zizania palustris TaxID=103762 RepID=A0A8J5RLN5_ZIZPA|nr:hypothetical protein GUJ93_ZPchr0009g904 [Zizania palustris]
MPPPHRLHATEAPRFARRSLCSLAEICRGTGGINVASDLCGGVLVEGSVAAATARCLSCRGQWRCLFNAIFCLRFRLLHSLICLHGLQRWTGCLLCSVCLKVSLRVIFYLRFRLLHRYTAL